MAAGGAATSSAPAVKKAKLGKCPTVRTDFLPDADREAVEEALRNRLKKVRTAS